MSETHRIFLGYADLHAAADVERRAARAAKRQEARAEAKLKAAAEPETLPVAAHAAPSEMDLDEALTLCVETFVLAATPERQLALPRCAVLRSAVVAPWPPLTPAEVWLKLWGDFWLAWLGSCR